MSSAESNRAEAEFEPETRIREARDGTRETVGRLLESYRNYLRVLARTSLDSRLAVKVDASDLVQETIVKAHQGFGQFRGHTERELVAWLRQILSRTLVDAVRRFQLGARRQIDREVSLDATVETSSNALGRFLPGRATTPSVVAQRREADVLLADALARLSADHREVIVLRSLQELSWAEVGNRMERQPDAVRMLWTRALQRLRPLIEGQG